MTHLRTETQSHTCVMPLTMPELEDEREMNRGNREELSLDSCNRERLVTRFTIGFHQRIRRTAYRQSVIHLPPDARSA
jgi:hypothetical protein